jgi:hypothetical protein
MIAVFVLWSEFLRAMVNECDGGQLCDVKETAEACGEHDQHAVRVREHGTSSQTLAGIHSIRFLGEDIV